MDSRAYAAPRLLDAIAALATASDDGKDEADRLLHLARELTGADQALIVAFAGEKSVIHGSTGALAAVESSALLDPLIGRAARAGGLVSIPDIALTMEDVRYLPPGVRSLAAAPLIAGGAVAGALELWSFRPGAFPDEAVRALQVLAGLLASTMGADLVPAGMVRAALPLAHYQALHDPVTGLPGRAILFDRLHQSVRHARREDAPLAVLSIALSHFGALVERLGPAAGAEVMQAFAQRVRDTLRASDTVARGGEENIVVLLPGANAIGALGTAKKMLRAVTAPLPVAGQHVALVASVGIAIFPEHGDDGDTLLARSGAALRQARDAGQECVTYSD
jgi:diguanylate cyclase (GGDEF)-like protein